MNRVTDRGTDRGTDVLVVLVPEVEGRESAAAALAAEGARIARALGGQVTILRIASADARPDVEESVKALAGRVRALQPRAVLMLDGDLSRELAPRLALTAGSTAIVGCTGVAVAGGATLYSKPVYGGWLEQELSYADGSLEVVTLVGSGLSAVAAESAGAPSATPPVTETTLEVGGAAGSPAVRRLEIVPPDFRTVDIVHAKRIVAAGMGASGPTPGAAGATPGPRPEGGPVTGEPAEPAGDGLMSHVRALAELLEGSVAATRPMVDEGSLPKDRLVGQTGKTVAPELYLALGISGSAHHVAGIQGAGTILAVDRDPAAPIFQYADAGYVADLREILPALVKRIEKWRDGGD